MIRLRVRGRSHLIMHMWVTVMIDGPQSRTGFFWRLLTKTVKTQKNATSTLSLFNKCLFFTTFVHAKRGGDAYRLAAIHFEG